MTNTQPTNGNEIRLRNGRVDDIVISAVDLRLEDMTGNQWWLGVYKGSERIAFWLTSKSKITVTIQEDMLNLRKVEQEKRKAKNHDKQIS